jgi:hypothetical protein
MPLSVRNNIHSQNPSPEYSGEGFLFTTHGFPLFFLSWRVLRVRAYRVEYFQILEKNYSHSHIEYLLRYL